MSTKAIRKCLLILKQDMPVSRNVERMVDEGLATLEAIERAAKALDRATIREVAQGGPDVHDAVAVLASIAKDVP